MATRPHPGDGPSELTYGWDVDLCHHGVLPFGNGLRGASGSGYSPDLRRRGRTAPFFNIIVRRGSRVPPGRPGAMGFHEYVCWSGPAVTVYAYAVYPAAVGLLAWLRPRPVRRRAAGPGPLPSVSVVLTVRDEARAVGRRVREFARGIAEAGLDGEVVVVSDGSTDGTAEAARDAGGPAVRVVETGRRVGKSAALSAGCRAAGGDVLVLADARQSWAPDAVVRLLENFDDPAVGAVSGALVVGPGSGVIGGVGLYWRFESWLRRAEAAAGSTAGVTGSISAVRRRLFRPIPAGTVLDDVYWPLAVAMQGYRVVYDGRARAYDRLPGRVSAEFRRKVRTQAGNYQLVWRLPAALLPWRNPAWPALVSHKLARSAAPWTVLASMAATAGGGSPVHKALFVTQAGVIVAGLAGLTPAAASRSRLAAGFGSFLVLNAAAWLGFWVWASGRSARSWTRTVYAPGHAPEPVLEGASP